MAGNDPTIEFKGDASGVEAAGQTTQQVIENVRRKLQDLQNPLGAMARAWGQVFNVSGPAGRAAGDIEKVGNSAKKTKGEVDGLDLSLKKLGTGVGIGLVVRQAQQMADAWTRSRNLIAAVGVDAQDLAGVQMELVKIAQDTRTALEPTVFLYSRMYRAVKPLGIAHEEVARAVEITNKAFKAGGAAVSEQNNAILQLSQALGSGLLQGDELRSVRENAPLIAKAIADEFDTTIAGLKKLGEQGELTTERVFKGIYEGGAAIDAQFAVTIPTIADGFTNLQTALIAFTGKANEASGASLAIGAGLNFVAENLGLLSDLVVAGAVAWGVYAAASAIANAQAGTLAASLTLTSIRAAIATTATALMSRNLYTMATAAAVARGALTLLMGPLGLAIAAGAGLLMLFGIMDKGADSTRNWGAEIASTKAKLESLQASIDDLDDDRITRTGTSMEGMGAKTETAAEKVERLADALDRANTARFREELLKADEVVEETLEQVEALRKAFIDANMWNLGFGAKQREEQLRNALQAAYDRINAAKMAKEEIERQGAEGRAWEEQKRLNDAIIAELDVRMFKVRDNAAEELRIMREKTEVIKNIYGDESTEYMKAVKDMETARDKLNRDAERAAKEAERRRRDEQKDILEQYDLQMEAAGENKEEVLRIMEEKLQKLKGFYGEDSREYARGLQEKIRMVERFAQEEVRIARESLKAAGDARLNELRSQLDDERTILDLRGAAVEEAVDRGYINEVQASQLRMRIREQELALEVEHQNRVYQASLQTLMDQLALEDMKPVERARVLGDIERLEAEHAAKLRELANKGAVQTAKDQATVAGEIQKRWQNILQPVQSSLSGMFRDLYNGTMGWRDAFLKVLDNILFSFVDMGIQMATKWAAQQLAMTVSSQTGAAARTAAVSTEAATTQGISAGSALMQIMNNAWTAASGAYAALAGVPIIGPVLAPAAAATALGAVLAFAGRIFSAKGGFGKVPADGSLTELHKDEMVLPADIASPLRSMLAQARGPQSPASLGVRAGQSFTTMQETTMSTMADRYGDNNFYYSPKYEGPDGSTSLGKMLRRDGRTMEKWLEQKFKGKRSFR